MKINIEKSWANILKEEIEKPYIKKLMVFVENQYTESVCFPPKEMIFNAFSATPFAKLKVVILGQDPYHKLGQAHGLSFSVPKGISIPPSLNNIFKELSLEYPDFIKPQNGDLTSWANQGVLLINATLTVRSSEAGSHQKKGWEGFTDKVIENISQQKENVVFMLWGNYAKNKKSLINENKHLILEASHPSPLSFYRGFLGCNHFVNCNKHLAVLGEKEIDWQLPT